MSAMVLHEAIGKRFDASVFAEFQDGASKSGFVRQLMAHETCTTLSPAILWARSFRTVGYVSQGRTLLSGFNVRENVYLPLLYRGQATRAEAMARIDRLCDFCCIPIYLLDRDTGALSALESIHASFLQAAVAEPELLVFDAVFDGLSHADQACVAKLISGYRSLFPLRPMLYLGYAMPDPELYAPTTVLPQSLT